MHDMSYKLLLSLGFSDGVFAIVATLIILDIWYLLISVNGILLCSKLYYFTVKLVYVIQFLTNWEFGLHLSPTVVIVHLLFSEDNVPTKKEVADAGHSVSRALEPDAAVFLAYAGTFVSIGLLWYVHHSLLHVSKQEYHKKCLL